MEKNMRNSRRPRISQSPSFLNGTFGCTETHEHANVVAKQLHRIFHTVRAWQPPTVVESSREKVGAPKELLLCCGRGAASVRYFFSKNAIVKASSIIDVPSNVLGHNGVDIHPMFIPIDQLPCASSAVPSMSPPGIPKDMVPLNRHAWNELLLLRVRVKIRCTEPGLANQKEDLAAS